MKAFSELQKIIVMLWTTANKISQNSKGVCEVLRCLLKGHTFKKLEKKMIKNQHLLIRVRVYFLLN